jgi:hypothetical protein
LAAPAVIWRQAWELLETHRLEIPNSPASATSVPVDLGLVAGTGLYSRALARVRCWWPPDVQPQVGTRRLQYVDLARGLFVLLMISSHAVGLSGVPDGTFLQSGWWLPRGWSTPGFVMLAGFSVGVVTTHGRTILVRILLMRAWELVIVMLASNAILAVCRELLHGDFGSVGMAEWVFRVITLQRDMTISIVLLPIAVGLVAVAGVVAVHRRVPIPFLIAALVAVNVGAWAAQDTFAASTSLQGSMWDAMTLWLCRYPLAPFASAATIGFALGVIWRPLVRTVQIDSRIVGPLTLVSLIAMAPLASVAPRPVFLSLDAMLEFLTILVLAVSLAAMQPMRVVSQGVAVLGRFSLMVFIVHRPMLHASDVLFRRFTIPATGRYVAMLAVSVGGSALLCLARAQSPSIDRALKRMFL